MSTHIAIWIDHKEARVFNVGAEGADEVTVTAPLRNTHHKQPPGPSGMTQHPEDLQRFFQDVARSADGAGALLIVGPSSAKLEFLRYLQGHEVALERKIIGVETVDHPTSRQIVAYAKNYFREKRGRIEGLNPLKAT